MLSLDGYQVSLSANLTLNLCRNTTCRYIQIRAWPPGEVCVSMNTVGMCSPRGACKMVVITPSSNVYPDIMVSIENKHVFVCI